MNTDDINQNALTEFEEVNDNKKKFKLPKIKRDHIKIGAFVGLGVLGADYLNVDLIKPYTESTKNKQKVIEQHYYAIDYCMHEKLGAYDLPIWEVKLYTKNVRKCTGIAIQAIDKVKSKKG